jgi:hypothetical protein
MIMLKFYFMDFLKVFLQVIVFIISILFIAVSIISCLDSLINHHRNSLMMRLTCVFSRNRNMHVNLSSLDLVA